ncbi:MAG: hypothetical protein ACRDCE_11275, partial [Cetobacterium sp.]|uniref:hypothetical protein n=1 Tax=Cetobacterium sp. TaxID=2071632 RepID=UPI003EE4A0C9
SIGLECFEPDDCFVPLGVGAVSEYGFSFNLLSPLFIWGHSFKDFYTTIEQGVDGIGFKFNSQHG